MSLLDAIVYYNMGFPEQAYYSRLLVTYALECLVRIGIAHHASLVYGRKSTALAARSQRAGLEVI